MIYVSKHIVLDNLPCSDFMSTRVFGKTTLIVYMMAEKIIVVFNYHFDFSFHSQKVLGEKFF